jgi:uncharacterized membrane protein
MPQFCAACGAQMADGAVACPACGRGTSQSTGGAAAAPQSSGGISPGVAGLLSYLLWIPAIIFLLIEPYNKDRTIRFHAFQGLFLGLVSIVGNIVLGMIPFIGWILMPFFWLAILIVAIMASVKAMQGTKMMIPVIGELAQKQADNM